MHTIVIYVKHHVNILKCTYLNMHTVPLSSMAIESRPVNHQASLYPHTYI